MAILFACGTSCVSIEQVLGDHSQFSEDSAVPSIKAVS
jgi:hypothetical protein